MSGGISAPSEEKLSTLLRRELDARGIRTLDAAARSLGVSYELVRRILSRDHVPKDRLITRMAARLGLDPAILITAAHRQTLPWDLRGHILPVMPVSSVAWGQKRKWPLSQEQCEYLGRLMQPHEIQLIRKHRQLTQEQRAQVIGYINYQFATNRVPTPAESKNAPPHAAGTDAV